MLHIYGYVLTLQAYLLQILQGLKNRKAIASQFKGWIDHLIGKNVNLANRYLHYVAPTCLGFFFVAAEVKFCW